MKKLFSVLTAAVIVFGMSATQVYAGPFDNAQQIDKHVDGDTINATEKTTEIPVYGYIGPDADIIVDPNNPEDPPTYTTYDINVIVPTSIIWAAFASDADNPGGNIVSPEYYIKNLSNAHDLDISINQFTENTLNNTDAGTVKPDLTLQLIGTDGLTTPTAFPKNLADTGSYIAATPGTPVSLGTLAKTDTLGVSTWNFSLGGTYTGDYDQTLYPQYNLEFKFEVND